ncbi:MAG: diguanylate cyclase domain-containing protein [Cellulosilyticaceae bacterium]
MFRNMTRKGINKSIKYKIVVLGIVVFLGMAVALKYEMMALMKNDPKEIVLIDQEKSILESVKEQSEEERQEFKQKALKKVLEFQRLSDGKKRDEYLGEIYYFLGYNSFLQDEVEDAKNFYERSILHLENTKHYFYLLNAHNELMKIYLNQARDIEAFEHASQIYGLLQNPYIAGMSVEEEKNLKIQVLSGMITVASHYGMYEISTRFYEELIELTEGYNNHSSISIYAKYSYNFNSRNYEIAEKYAREYIEFYTQYSAEYYEAAHIYLLEVWIHKGELDKASQLLECIEPVYQKKNNLFYLGYLNKLKGILYEKQENYQEAVSYYEQALREFEEIGNYKFCVEISQSIVKLYDRAEIDIERYIQRAIAYESEYDAIEEISMLADGLIKIIYQKEQEKNRVLSEEIETMRHITILSKKMSYTYFVILILAILLVKFLRTEVKQGEAKTKELAYMLEHDYLTGAYSREYIYTKLQHNMKIGKHFCLVLIDIDNFKKVNDTYGHLFGDEVLTRVVERITHIIGGKGQIGRFGGEEFMMIYEEPIDGYRLHERISQELRKINWSQEGFSVTISGGLKKWQQEDIGILIRECDRRLYEAKQLGKNRIIG